MILFCFDIVQFSHLGKIGAHTFYIVQIRDSAFIEDAQRFYRKLPDTEIRDEGIWIDL